MMSIRQVHAFGRKTIQIGRLTNLVAIDAERLWGLVISQDEQEVGTLLLCRARLRSKRSREN